MEKSYGIKRDKILKKNIFENIPELKKKKFNKIIINCLREGKTYKQYMTKFYTKNGIKYYNLTN